MKKQTLIKVVLLFAVIIGAVGWLIVRWNRESRSGVRVVSTGPLDIRLWGIRPSAGDAIYDANGKEICQTLGLTQSGNPYWRDSEQRFEFIFELPKTNEPPFFTTFPRVEVSGANRHLGGIFGHKVFNYKGKRLLQLKTTLPRTFRKSILLGLRTAEIGVDAIDITLRYYHGPPRPAVATFKGPFKPGGKYTDEKSRHKISFSQSPNSGAAGHIRFEFNAKGWLGTNIPALLYDAAGKRRFANSAGAFSGPGGTNIKYDVFDQNLKGITMIAIDEKPYETTFKNVRLDLYPSRLRSHAAYLDKMAEKLDLELTVNKLAANRLKDVNETLDVMNIVRGRHIISLCNDILHGYQGKYENRPDITALSEEQAHRLRQTTLRWTEAMDPSIRGYAMMVGLHCKWREFLEPAFELLAEQVDYDYYSSMRVAQNKAAAALLSYRDNLSEKDIDRIKHIIMHQEHRDMFSTLERCLQGPKSEGRIRALWELAQDDRPWLWWDAVEQLAQLKEFEGKHDSLADKLKLRLFSIRGAPGFSNADEIAPRANALLDGLLTPQLRALDPATFDRVLDKILKNPDRRLATTALVNYLRRIEGPDSAAVFAVTIIVKHLNLWYGLDIGNLGSDVHRTTPEVNSYDVPAIIAEAIHWYETTQKADEASTSAEGSE